MRDVRSWTHAALFGALWGALEATLGTAVHLGKLPLRGTLMGLAGLLCLVCLRRLQPKVGVCLLAGVVAIFLKIFTLGGLYPGPIIGIAIEALSVEVAMTAGRNRAIGAIVGGAVALATNPLQKLGMIWVVAGPEAVESYFRLFQETANLIGFGDIRPVTLLGTVVIGGALIGGFGGIWAWRVAGRVVSRLGDRP